MLLAVIWLIGEANDRPWLRRVSGLLLICAVASIAVALTTISVSIDDSLRYSGAVKQFVSRVIFVAERDGEAVAVEQLRRFDAVSIQTYEGGALLRWLTEPLEASDSERFEERTLLD